MKKYKFLREGLKSDYNGFQWKIGEWHQTECVELCHGFNCSARIIDALLYVRGEILAEVEARGKHFEDTDKSTWQKMKIVKAYYWTKADGVALAVYAAELVIDIFEKEFPDDKRPRKAIEAAKSYLKNRRAAGNTWAAADAARDARAEGASRAAGAAMAAWAAARAARAEGAAAAAEWAYAAASWVDCITRTAISDKIEEWLVSHVKEMRVYEEVV